MTKRHQAALEKLTAQTDAPKITAAKASFQVKRRITDPTLINPTTTPRKRAKTITNKLNKATGSNNNPIEVDNDTPTIKDQAAQFDNNIEAPNILPEVQQSNINREQH